MVRRVASNSISKHIVANEIIMEIFEEGNLRYKPFGCLDESKTLKHLSSFRDITLITAVYEDEPEDTFYIHYDEGEQEGILGAENINEDIYHFFQEYPNL